MAKTQRMSDAAWDKYKTIVSDFIDVDAGREPIIWKRFNNQPTEFGEDTNRSFLDVTLEVLVSYNYFRTWPLNKGTVSGEIDNESTTIWVSARLLRELNYLDANNYWIMDGANDRFIIRGKVYKASGDTELAQAKNEPLLYMVILKREEKNDLTQL